MKKALLTSLIEKRKLFLLLLLATSLCIFIPAQIIYRQTTGVLEDNARSRALSIATTIATFLEDDIEAYRNLSESSTLLDNSQEHADYLRFNRLLRTIKEESGADFVYTEALVDASTIRYVLDAELPDSENFSAFNSLDEMDDTESGAYAGRQIATSNLLVSEWGTLLSAFAPIIDGRDNSLVGLVGVDYSADTLLAQSRALLWLHIVTFSLLSLLLSFSLFVIMEAIGIHAYTDELTGLGNRRALNRALARVEKEARKNQKTFVLLTLDVDAFKQINDEYGHPVGDKVLIRIADTLLQHSIWENGCFRSGGDEYVVLLPESNLEQAEPIRDMIQADVQAIFLPELKGQTLSVSIGLAQWHETESLEDLAKRSDASLYEMKKNQAARKKG